MTLGLLPSLATLGALLPATVWTAAPATALPGAAVSPAVEAAAWLEGRVGPGGFVPTSSGAPDLSATAQVVLALASANFQLTGAAQRGLGFLEGNVDRYVTVSGSDGPGQLALLILDAEALGANPRFFGGTNLVARLQATEQTAGSDDGLFGTQAQVTNFSAGGYQQGLALAALAGAGVHANAAAIRWLVDEQCPDGGWTSPDNASNPCTGTPANSAGPDTNSTALAIQGLAAQQALGGTTEARATAFLRSAQDPDAGWSFFPNTAATPGVTDPNSTALVIQALLATGISSGAPAFARGAATPISALLSFQLRSGIDAGAFLFPGQTGANLVATYQAVPALAGQAFPLPSPAPYQQVASDGGIFTFGGARFFGSTGAIRLNKPIVGMAPTPDGRGYWLVASDGGIFSFGDARFFGSMGGMHLNKPIVGMAATPDGRGYWEVASDGGIFTFGDARFFGSTGAMQLNKPIVGMAPTPDGQGYWMVASDGGIFSFGDARFFGSTGAIPLNKPVVGMAATPDGQGYWMVASDGGIFTFGDARFFGSTGAIRLNKPVVGMAATPAARGYWLVASDGGIFSFGDAPFSGSTGGTHLNQPIVGMSGTWLG